MADTIAYGTYQVAAGDTEVVFSEDSLIINKLTVPSEITGVVTVYDTDDGDEDGLITLSQDMTVTATGELTLDIPDVASLRGGKVITVQPEGKIKLTNGRQITVLAGTLYKLKAS